MKITEAIDTADTEHVVYFLLAAYVETLEYHADLHSLLCAEVRRLPVEGLPDISRRLSALAGAMDRCTKGKSRSLIEEAIEVFGSAMQRLRHLQGVRPFVCGSLFFSPPGPHACHGADDGTRARPSMCSS